MTFSDLTHDEKTFLIEAVDCYMQQLTEAETDSPRLIIGYELMDALLEQQEQVTKPEP